MGPRILQHRSQHSPVGDTPNFPGPKISDVLRIVHEISGVVPKSTIEGLLRVIGVDAESGVDAGMAKGGFGAVRKAVKQVGREGWSAGQVLEQVRGPNPLPDVRN
jgi:hypothetical protein